MKKFPFFKQLDSKDCGPNCLKIVARHFGKTIPIQELRELSETLRIGTTLQGLCNAAERIGIRTLPAKISYNQLDEVPLPCILHWNNNHFLVLYRVKKDTCYVSDPAYGLLTYTKDEFVKHWIGNNADETTEEGIALLLEPTPKFYDVEYDPSKSKVDFTFLAKYLFRYKKFLLQLLFGLLAGSLLQLLFPFFFLNFLL